MNRLLFGELGQVNIGERSEDWGIPKKRSLFTGYAGDKLVPRLTRPQSSSYSTRQREKHAREVGEQGMMGRLGRLLPTHLTLRSLSRYPSLPALYLCRVLYEDDWGRVRACLTHTLRRL